MSRSRRPAGDAGNALVEFVYLAVLLLIPLVYLLLAVFRVQAAAFGVTEAARQAGRAYARAEDLAGAEVVGTAAARLALADQGITWTGAPEFCDGTCSLAPGSTVRTAVTYTVALPFVGSLFGAGHAGIPVHGVHVEVVDRFRQGP